MPMDLHKVRLQFLAKYGNCNRDDIPMIVLIFLEEYKNCDWDEIPMMIFDYLKQEVCNLPNVVVDDEMDEDEEENEVNYYPHNVSPFVLQDSSIIEPNLIENSDFEDDEIIYYVDDYSNDYVPHSFKFVYDDSEDEEDEYYAYDNSPQTTSQAILQESNSFEHEPMENSAESECSNSDFGESMEEEASESCVMPDFEAEKSAATTFGLVENEPNVSCQGSNDMDDHNDIIKKLQEMLEISDQRLDELVESRVGDNSILDAEFYRFYQANGEQAKAEILGENDSMTMESKSGSVSNCVPCVNEFEPLIEPKPPSKFFKEMIFSGGEVKSKTGFGLMNQMLNFDNFASLNKTNKLVLIHYFEEPPDYSLCGENHLCLRVRITKFQVKSRKFRTRFTHFSLRMNCIIVKPKKNILQNEYDWKGRFEKITVSHIETILWELEPD